MPISAARLRAWSERRAEPSEITRRRLRALELLDDLTDGDWRVLESALDEEPGSLAPLAPELAAQKIRLEPLAEADWWPPAPERRASLVERVAEAFWTGGAFIRAPQGVRAEFALHASAGLRRFGRVERTLILVEKNAELEYVEGCTELGGPTGRRWSLTEAFVGEGARLTGASVQAWPRETLSVALKRARVAAAGRLEWTDANLGASQIEKTIEASLAKSASANVLCGGFAGSAQRQTLALLVDSGVRELEILAGFSGDGFIEARAPAVRRLADASREAFHGFFEPLARRLPLEFSVEFSRLLDVFL